MRGWTAAASNQTAGGETERQFEEIINGANSAKRVTTNGKAERRGRKEKKVFCAICSARVSPRACVRVTLKCQGVYTWLILTPLVSGTLIMTDSRV